MKGCLMFLNNNKLVLFVDFRKQDMWKVIDRGSEMNDSA